MEVLGLMCGMVGLGLVLLFALPPLINSLMQTNEGSSTQVSTQPTPSSNLPPPRAALEPNAVQKRRTDPAFNDKLEAVDLFLRGVQLRQEFTDRHLTDILRARTAESRSNGLCHPTPAW